MIAELPIDSIIFNELNPRFYYDQEQIAKLSASMAQSGQLVAVRVRPLGSTEKYELLFGHRRLLAAKELGWKTIRAEITETKERQTMLEQALIENFYRADLSDYEKAVTFQKLNSDFCLTYEEIGKMVGLSKSQICGYVTMLKLFDDDYLCSHLDLKAVYFELSEHHARILSRVDDLETRKNLVLLVAKDHLTVKELTHMVAHLRSWFGKERTSPIRSKSLAKKSRKWDDIQEITKLVFNEFQLSAEGDFQTFKEMHLFEKGFSMFPAFPPFERVEHSDALTKECTWFYSILPRFRWKIEDLKVNVFDRFAISTLVVRYSPTKGTGESRKELCVRGTIVFTKCSEGWRILHEHWSSVSLAIDINMIESIPR